MCSNTRLRTCGSKVRARAGFLSVICAVEAYSRFTISRVLKHSDNSFDLRDLNDDENDLQRQN